MIAEAQTQKHGRQTKFILLQVQKCKFYKLIKMDNFSSFNIATKDGQSSVKSIPSSSKAKPIYKMEEFFEDNASEEDHVNNEDK